MSPAPRAAAGPAPLVLSGPQARGIWLRAQRLDERAPFGAGPGAVTAALRQLGYVQIDTINVIERSHHHILFSRIPAYRRADLSRAQSHDKSVFEYWTHALAYIPVEDFRFFVAHMRAHRREPRRWGQTVTTTDYRRVVRMIRESGPVTIRDIEDRRLVEKEHPWASRKPSKGALQLAFWNGVLTISERTGMLKTYELTERHFGWDGLPPPATARQTLDYLIDRALRAQGVVSLASIAYGSPGYRSAIRALIEAREKRGTLRRVDIADSRVEHWATPETIETATRPLGAPLVHILSPFDPLVIQRERTALFFGYDHVFEAYVPREKRRFGYFTLPVLLGDEIVAALDLKADRETRRLRIQAWHWIGSGGEHHRPAIEAELDRFAAFQFGE